MALDRTGLIEQLERLGAANDATVLEAARAVHQKVAESGLSWDELIRGDETVPDRSTDETEISGTQPPPDAAEIGRLIDRLLRKDVSETLREDLAAMKSQLNDGTLDPQDACYVRALAKRLRV